MKSKRIRWIAAVCGAAAVAVLAVVVIAQAQGDDGDGDPLAKTRSATLAYMQTTAAQAAGWDLRQGLDSCFENPGVGAMGFHYINLDLLNDLSEDPLKPEALVYPQDANGNRTLGAVEWIVPAKPWDDAGNKNPPQVLGHPFHLNTDLGVYILHAWIFKDNPKGVFEDWNPNVACPHNWTSPTANAGS